MGFLDLARARQTGTPAIHIHACVPLVLSQAILAGIILVGRLGLSHVGHRWTTTMASPWLLARALEIPPDPPEEADVGG